MTKALYTVEDENGERLDDTGDGGFTVWDTRAEAQDALESREDAGEKLIFVRYVRVEADNAG